MVAESSPVPPAIEVKELCVERGGMRVLHSLSFEVAPGRITGLLGPSGCGKTTLMRCVVGVQIIASGSVTVLGHAAGALRERSGYVTQAPSVYGDLTARENLHYFCRVLGAPSERAAQTIGDVRLERQADQVVRTMSGGQRARVSLATALLGEPELLVLDEPTVGLDPVLRHDLWEMFSGFAESGITLLVSSHVMDEAEHCDDLLLMRDGRLLATESPDALRRRTGEDDLEDAFLRLIEEDEAGA
jgi:ABC-2 type transport system ATP-binding protein